MLRREFQVFSTASRRIQGIKLGFNVACTHTVGSGVGHGRKSPGNFCHLLHPSAMALLVSPQLILLRVPNMILWEAVSVMPGATLVPNIKDLIPEIRCLSSRHYAQNGMASVDSPKSIRSQHSYCLCTVRKAALKSRKVLITWTWHPWSVRVCERFYIWHPSV